jgi:hypothetical protein
MNRSILTKDESHEEEMLRRIIAIDQRTESMDDSMHWMVRSGDALRDTMVAAFGQSAKRIQVYLSLDGTKNVNAIAKSLKMHAQNVTRELRWLKRKRLIAITKAKGKEVIYCKPNIDSVIGLSHELMEKFGLDRLGRSKK